MLTFLVPGSVLPTLDALDHLGTVEVVLQGTFPVSDRAEAAFIKAENEAEVAGLAAGYYPAKEL